jgi:hypothetical protein
MQIWNATHDNGWSTMVVENPNGSFAAWAAASRLSATPSSRNPSREGCRDDGAGAQHRSCRVFRQVLAMGTEDIPGVRLAGSVQRRRAAPEAGDGAPLIGTFM